MKFTIIFIGILLFLFEYTPTILLSVLDPTSQVYQYIQAKVESHSYLIMAPGDLNLKKSWNPALMKNQKKLWDEEQKQLELYKIAKQRQEELNKEKEQLELLKLQYGDDLSNLPRDHKLSLNKMNWMYDDGNARQSKINKSGFNEVDEEFLLNKKKVEDMLNNEGVALKRSRDRENSGFNKVIGDSSKKSKVPLSDDPLLQIKKEMKRKRIRSRQIDPCKAATPTDEIERTFAPKPCRPKVDERSPRHRHHRREGRVRKEGEEQEKLDERRHRQREGPRREGPHPERPRSPPRHDRTRSPHPHHKHPHPHHKHPHPHPHPHPHHHKEDQIGCIEQCPAL